MPPVTIGTMSYTETEDKKTERIISVDVTRGLALILMVMVHFMVYLGDAAAVDTWPYFLFNHVLADWGAVCFLLMMGIGILCSVRLLPIFEQLRVSENFRQQV